MSIKVPEFIVVQVGSGSIFQPQSTVVTSDYSSTLDPGGIVIRRGTKYRGPKGRERVWGSWGGAASPSPPAKGSGGVL